MKTKVVVCFMVVLCGVMMPLKDTFAVGRLAPRDFNKMYYLASQGRVGILRSAVNRGLNIDSVNPNGDTGLCIAIKRKNYIAYNSFRMSGANPRHACTYKIYKEYQRFLDSTKTVRENMIIGNKESLQYREEEKNWWPWILGGVALGGVAASSGGGGGSSAPDSTIIPVTSNDGLGVMIENYNKLVNGSSYGNRQTLDASNPNASSVVDKIDLLPNIVDNYQYLKSYIKVENGGYFENMLNGSLILGDKNIGKSGDGAIGVTVEGDGSKGVNNGHIKIDAYNGAIGMVASGGGEITNSPENGDVNPSSNEGKIDIIFKGNEEGDAVIGMYADTNSKAINYGVIKGTTSSTEGIKATGIIDSVLDVVEDNTEEEIGTPNSGSILGMAVMGLYTAKDYSSNEVVAENNGLIDLTAGYNGATDASVSLVGMGSYIDDKFLKGNSNPELAEKMTLNNNKNIKLSYQGAYKISEGALKLGKGGLIGIRADAKSVATNKGNIDIDMQATTISNNVDVAAGMLSVHGAELKNEIGAKIKILNEASSGGVAYGMLASKGEGLQTNIYKWKAPKLTNNGIIDMQVSNSYAVASFAGGDIVNNGVINLGVENGHSYYTNNYGLYADGMDKTEEVRLVNEGLINVYSEQSTAIYNAFAGSVYMENSGTIYVSNKATKSKIFGGNYSTLLNSGAIDYKVGNTADYKPIAQEKDNIGLNMETTPLSSVVSVSGDSVTTKQSFINRGDMSIGERWEEGKDYGGTYVTAGVQVSKQGTAYNRGNIRLNLYEKDREQFNVGMWLDDTSTAEAYAENYGSIYVDATNSSGMRNDSALGSVARNFGDIYVNGTYGYGMAAQNYNATIFNGLSNSSKLLNQSIHVNSVGSIGMYVKNAKAYNYGKIYLNNDSTTAFQLDGETARAENDGDIIFDRSLNDVTFFWMTNGAVKEFSYPNGIDIEGYTLAKATTDNSGGTAIFAEGSIANVKGKNSYLFVTEGKGSAVYNYGIVNLDDAVSMVGSDGASVINQGNVAQVVVDDATSIGIKVKDAGTTASNNSGARVNVEKGIGIHASNYAEVNNASIISVQDKGIGIYLTDGVGNQRTKGTNTGSISVSGDETKGVNVEAGALFANNGEINVSNQGGDSYAYGIYSKSDVTTNGSSVIKVEENSYGIYANSGSVSNGGIINVNKQGSYGIYSDNARVENSGTINVKGGTGIIGNAVVNNGMIKIRENGIGIEGYVNNNSDIMIEKGIGIIGSGSNSGLISVSGSGSVGVDVDGVFTNMASGEISGYADEGLVKLGDGDHFRNEGIVNVGGGVGILVDGEGAEVVSVSERGVNVVSGIGIKVVNGSVTSNDMTVAAGTGIKVENGSVTSKDMTVAGGTGIEVNGGYAESTGNMTVDGGVGIKVTGGRGVNSGTITVRGGTGAHVTGGTFTNTGTIEYDGEAGAIPCNNNCGGTIKDLSADEDEQSLSLAAVMPNLIYVNDGEFVNNGDVILKGVEVDFDEMSKENATFTVAKGGTYTADLFSGDVKAEVDIVKGGFEDTYVNENSFVGENNGLNVSSKSYMFDAKTNVKGDVTDIELNRKSFEDIVEEKDLAEFFEINYNLNHNEKMYDSLKSATNKKEFNAAVQNESGKKFYANLPRENVAVVRGISSNEQTRILQDGIKGKSVGANFFRTGKDGVSNLSGYEDDVYSAHFGFGKKINKNWSMGGTLSASYVDSSYDDINSDRENKILMAFMPILYQNDKFKYLATPHIGFGVGSYTRSANSGDYKADTFDIYYGMTNHAEYSVDVKVAELVMEAELNMLGIKSDDMDEKGGFNLKSNDTLSLEAGVGLKLRKKIEFDKRRSLMLAIGSKYYQELLDPYDDLDVTIKGSNVSFNAGHYDEDKKRIKTTLEAVYKDGDVSVGAEISHNKEKESNIEGGLGVRYNFN